MIIAMTGPQGVGKDATAAILAEYGFTKLAFADALRAEVVAAFGCTPELLTDRDQKDADQEALSLNHCADNKFVLHMAALHTLPESATGQMDSWLRCPRSPRWILQQWGTEYRRTLFGADYWIKQLLGEMTAIDIDIVITDCRMDNEAMFISQSLNAEIWKITRPGHDYKPGHASEIPVANYWIDRWINNNGSLLELRCAVQDALHAARYSQEAA